jgi:hypothetical protein
MIPTWKTTTTCMGLHWVFPPSGQTTLRTGLVLLRLSSTSDMLMRSRNNSTMSSVLCRGNLCALGWILSPTHQCTLITLPSRRASLPPPADRFPACEEAFPDGLFCWSETLQASVQDYGVVPEWSQIQYLVCLLSINERST